MIDTQTPKTILITGGRGLIGKRLTKKLLKQGHRVLWYSRNISRRGVLADGVYYYNIETYEIDNTPLLEADIIIHLAGANISAHRWTKEYKREILRSRTISLQLINREIKRLKSSGIQLPLKQIISSSSIGYYGVVTSADIFSEEDVCGEDFLSSCAFMLEKTVKNIGEQNEVDVSILRLGLVLSSHGGVLPRMYRFVQLGFNTPIGEGYQYVNWIHIDDVCRMFIAIVNNRIPCGIYNAVAPSPVTNEQFMYALSFLKGRWLPKVRIPEWIVLARFGEMSQVLLEGTTVSSELIQSCGFEFKYPTLGKALRHIILKKRD